MAFSTKKIIWKCRRTLGEGYVVEKFLISWFCILDTLWVILRCICTFNMISINEKVDFDTLKVWITVKWFAVCSILLCKVAFFDPRKMAYHTLVLQSLQNKKAPFGHDYCRKKILTWGLLWFLSNSKFWKIGNFDFVYHLHDLFL